MKVLNLLEAGEVGGIETLCQNIAEYADYENTFVFLFQGGTIYEEMKQAGKDVISLADCGEKKLGKERLNKLLAIAKNYDIIVVHHSALAIQMCYLYLKCRLPRKKFVATVHSCFEANTYYHYGWAKNQVRAFVQKRMLAVSDRIIFVSEAGKRSYVKEFRLDKRKLRVVYNGIKLPENFGTDAHTFDPDNIRMTFIGRLVEVKGVQLLIPAIAKLRDEGIRISLCICGEGDYRGELEKLTAQYQLGEQVRFMGTQRNLALFLRDADMFAYPSVCEEVFGISIVEAMAYGVPCVAFRSGGIPEIVKDGKNGAIAEHKEIDELKDAIKRILAQYQNGSAQKMRKCCLQTAQRFTVQNTVKGIQQCFEEIMKEN